MAVGTIPRLPEGSFDDNDDEIARRLLDEALVEPATGEGGAEAMRYMRIQTAVSFIGSNAMQLFDGQYMFGQN